MRGLLALSLLLLVALATCRDLQQDRQGPSDVEGDDPPAWRRPRAERQALVKFKAGAGPVAKGRALARGNAEASRVVASTPDGEVVLVRFGPQAGPSTAKAAKKVEQDDNVEYVEPNFLYTKQVVSDDPYFTGGSLWGMYGSSTSPSNQFGTGAATAWASGATGSSDVYVGVIDEGIYTTHPDLAANIWQNPFDAADGTDNDGNGYRDDINGWDFSGNNNGVFDGVGDDHGTHVSGTIGAVGGNKQGVAGVAWNVKLISAKFLGSNGGYTSDAIEAVDYITDLKTRHNLNIVATSNSWGGGGYSAALAEAIGRAADQNILFIAAAGNAAGNVDTSPSYPCSYSNANIICVASITSSGGLSSFSNWGATGVDIGAPGSGIWSTVPTRTKPNKPITPGYASYNGTSMATPHVTGAAVLFAAEYLRIHKRMPTAQEIKDAILSSAVATPSLNGKCVSNGRLNVVEMLKKIPPPSA